MTAGARVTSNHLRDGGRRVRLRVSHPEDSAPPSPPGWEKERGPSLSRAVWRYRYVVLVVALLSAVAGYVYQSSKPPLYEAATRIELRNPYAMTLFRNELGTAFTDVERYLSSQAAMVTSPPVMARASQLLGGGQRPAQIRQSVSAQSSTKIFELTVQARSGDPATAANTLNAVTKAYQEVAEAQVRGEVARKVEALRRLEAELRTRLAELPGGDERDSAVGELTAVVVKRGQIQTDAAIYGAGIARIDEARQPELPVSDTPRRRAVIFGLLGLIGALVVAFWRGERVRMIDSGEDAAAAVNAPLLGAVPRHPADTANAAAPVLASPDSPAAREYGFIAATLALAPDSEHRVILVTSLDAGPAKSVTALNLALSAAQDQRSTVLLDVEPAGLLTSLLRTIGTRGASDLVALSAAGFGTDLRDGSVTPIEGLESFRFVPTGTREVNGRDTAGSPQLAKILVQLQQEADLVFVDGPALRERPGGVKLAAAVDGVVLIVPRGTRLEHLQRVSAMLAAARTPIAGVLFDRSPAASWWRRRQAPVRRRRSRR